MNKINYLKEININFNKIKRLTLKINNNFNNDNVIQEIIKNCLETLFSFNNIENNLIYLDIDFTNYETKNDLFKKIDNINNFKSLRYLYIKNLKFNKDFIIELNELKLLSIKSCKNLKLSSNFNEKLRELILRDNKISNLKILKEVNCIRLSKLDLCLNEITDIDILEKVNFKKLKELYLSCNKISSINILEKVNFKNLNI